MSSVLMRAIRRSWEWHFEQTISKPKALESGILPNHVLHHIPPEDLAPFLRKLRLAARRRLLVNDLERSAVSYGLYTLLAGVAFHKSFVFADGRLSIRKGFRAPELEATCVQAGFPPGFRVERMAPWRVVITAVGG
jgi:hypothetical protein